MKLFVCCFIAVTFSVVTCTAMESKLITIKLQEVLKELNWLKTVKQNETLMLNTPKDFEECCSVSALQCFAGNLQMLRAPHKSLTRKMRNSLKSEMIVKAVNSRCNPGFKSAKCQECNSYPKTDSKKFLDELGSVLQKAHSRLMEKI